jgi:hypothetical protein
VVARKGTTGRRADLGRVQEDVGDRPAVGVADGEKTRGMSGKWKAMWNSSPSPKYAHVRRPLVGLGEEDPALVMRVHPRADLLEIRVRLRQVRSSSRPARRDRYRVAAEAVEALVEPEGHDAQHLLADGGVVVVEIGLVVKKPVPVEGLGHRIPRPVRRLRVDKDNARVAVGLVVVAPYVVVTKRRVGRAARRPKPGVLVGGVVHHEIRDHAKARACAASRNFSKSAMVP